MRTWTCCLFIPPEAGHHNRLSELNVLIGADHLIYWLAGVHGPTWLHQAMLARVIHLPPPRIAAACYHHRPRHGDMRFLSTNQYRVLDEDARKSFAKDGFVLVKDLVPYETALRLRERYECLFAGKFETGIFPDEWHWREGLSFPTAAREIVNAWKSDTTVAHIARDEGIGYLIADLMSWKAGCRLGQDDVLWKPPGAGGVGWHQDSAYISDQFMPLENNSVTVWIALDDADEETGVVQYAKGSHKWTCQHNGALYSSRESSFHGSSHEADPLVAVRTAAKRAGVQDLGISSLSVPIGGAILHHQNVWHGSGPNISSTRHRRALALHLLRKDVVFRSSPKPDYIYGRYQIGTSNQVDHSFFPVIYQPQ